LAGHLPLHPVFGPGEDRNGPSAGSASRHRRSCTRSSDRVRIATRPAGGRAASTWPALHPVFGPGEDRNRRPSSLWTLSVLLHPVFGPGEDRNSVPLIPARIGRVAAPGLRTG